MVFHVKHFLLLILCCFLDMFPLRYWSAMEVSRECVL